MSSTNPVRYPDTSSPSTMTKRAWWLVGLNFLLPGSAQVVAGNRRLGRFGLGATILMWGLGLVLLGMFLFWRTGFYTIFSTTISLWVVVAVLVFYGILWLVLSVNALSLARVVKAAPVARPFIAGLATVLLVASVGGAGYGAYIAGTASGFLSEVFVTAPAEPPIDGRYNIMLLGGDAGADREGLRPDSISVVSLDVETGAATIIGLPRNLEYARFDEGSPLAEVYPDGYGADGCRVDVCLLNSIYTEVELRSPEMYPNAEAEGSAPGIEGMRDAVEGITGLQVQYYALIDMQGFSDLIDALGGVTITIAEPVPIHADETFTTVAEWIPAGVQHLDGYHALWYARSRHNTDDYDRMARQRQLQEAMLEQFTPANVLSKFQAIAEAGSQVVRTDVPQGSLGYFVDLATKTRGLAEPFTEVDLVPANGIRPEDPDFEYIRQLVQEALVESTPAPTPAG